MSHFDVNLPEVCVSSLIKPDDRHVIFENILCKSKKGKVDSVANSFK